MPITRINSVAALLRSPVIGCVTNLGEIIVFKFVAALILIFVISNSYAGNAWYWGGITSIRTSGADGSFEVDMNNSDVKSFCKWDRVYFRVADMGAERTKVALSMALTAFTASKNWGVVIDLSSTEEICYASPTASQGSGIK